MTIPRLLRRLGLTAAVAILTACAGTGAERQHPTRTDPPPAAARADTEQTELRDTEQDAAPTSVDVLATVANTSTRDKAIPADRPETQANAAHLTLARRMAPAAELAAMAYGCCPVAPTEAIDRENYGQIETNPVRLVSEHPVSTFSIDVDSGAYANVRRFLHDGRLPPDDAVRVEELLNYFAYDYPTPRNTDTPFNVITALAPTPWNDETLLLKVALKGFEIDAADRAPANLVFLVDVSGSMQSADKLPLLKDALRMLTRQLDERDTIAIAGYAGGAGLILAPTSGAHGEQISSALDSLRAAGRTNGAAGIHLAYELAERSFQPGGINRVILATDGDFNVGTVNFDALVDLIENKRENGVALTALGFGTGNYNDHLLEQLADAGNGNYAYIDSQREARKVLVEQMSSTLQTIASDVKIQIEFNPETIAEYRLIGYENRMLRREDFNNDRIDAGEIGAGHTVTALYELTPHGSAGRLIDPLRYGTRAAQRAGNEQELAFVRLRYKQPGGRVSELIERPVHRRALQAISDDFAFAAAVAAFGQRLRGGAYLNDYDYDSISALAGDALGDDRHGYRREFVELVSRAQQLSQPLASIRRPDHHLRVAH